MERSVKNSISAYDIMFKPGDTLVYINGDVVNVLDVMPNQQMRAINNKTGQIHLLDQEKCRKGIKDDKIMYRPESDEESHEKGKDMDEF